MEGVKIGSFRGQYLSPGGEDFRGDHLIFRRTKGRISRKREPKRGISERKVLKDLEGFRGGTTHICLENEGMGGGGSRKLSIDIRGASLQ